MGVKRGRKAGRKRAVPDRGHRAGPLALIFFEPSRKRVPWSTAAECWALGWDTVLTAPERGKVARWYEIHPYRVWESGMVPPLDKRGAYRKWLAELPGVNVLDKRRKDVPGSVAYPIDAVVAMPGVGTYLAFMLCQAVLEGWRDIGIYGCDFGPASEWQDLAFERPNLAYLMGPFRAQSDRIRALTLEAASGVER